MNTHTRIIFTIMAIIASFSAYSADITISKYDSEDPSDVCNNSTYKYVTTITGWNSNYTVAWIKTNAEIVSQSTSQAEVKWIADSESDGYIGTIKAQIKNGSTVIAESNTIEVTIKSIKHLKPEIGPYFGAATVKLSPCVGGQLSLEVPRLEVPGTGTFPDKINDYEWIIPSGWELYGQTSNGSKGILGGYNVTVYYPASATGGTIKVRANSYISGCDAEIQVSKYSETITVERDVSWNLTSNKNYFLCGDTDPITFTMAPTSSSPDVSCAVFYWNNSTTPTSSNTFQVTPGTSDLIVTVKAVYGGKEVTKNITVPVEMYDGVAPQISGPSVVCSSGSTFLIDNLPNVDSIIWIPGPNVTVHSGQYTDSPVIKATGDGVGGISVRLVNACGEITLGKYLWAGTPVIIGLDGPTYVPSDVDTRYYPLYGYPVASPTNFMWIVTPDDGVSYDSFGWSTLVNFSNSGYYNIIYRGLNTCGWGDWYYSPTIQVYNSYYMMISPNPTSGEVVISIEQEAKEKSFDDNIEWELEIFDNVQNLKAKKTKLHGKEYRINTAGWKDGVYMIRAKYKDEVLTGKLIVKQ